MPAFSAVNTFGCLYCAVYLGMGSAIRLLSSVYAGEEDRESLRILMKTALTKGLAAVAGVALLTFLLAEPFTRIFFSPADGAYGPALLFFRIFPLSVPVSAFFIFFNNYYQSMGRMRIVNFLSTMDGVVSNSLISLALAPLMGYLGVWIAQVAAGILTALMIPVCAGIVLRRIPRGLKDLMLLPEDFGVPEEDRMELTVTDTAQALQTSGQVIDFCLAHGTDRRRAAAAGLCLEEMAVNVIQHGFRPGHEDRVMVRVVYKEDSLMIRLKDSCPPFNPKERAELFDPEDRAHNVGIRLAARLSKKMEYEFILGLNVLTLTL